MNKVATYKLRRFPTMLAGLGLGLGLLGTTSGLRSGEAVPASAGVEVEGQLVETDFSAKGDVQRLRRDAFMVRVLGERWLIQTEDQDVREGRLESVQRREVSCDGRDLFELNVFPTALARGGLARSTNRLYAFARADTFPAAAQPSERILWLAFCSAPNLSLNSKLPSLCAPTDSSRQPVSCRLERLPGSGLPSLFEQTAPGAMVMRSHGRDVRLDYPPPFDRGFLEFSFRATALTNLDGWTLPLAFEAEFFTIDSRFRSNAVRRVANRRIGTITCIRAAVGDQWRPELTEAANVYDYRFTNRSGGTLMYVETNKARWIEREDPFLRQTILSKKELPVYGRKPRPVKQGEGGAARAIVLSAIVATTFGFLVWALAVKTRPRKQTKT